MMNKKLKEIALKENSTVKTILPSDSFAYLLEFNTLCLIGCFLLWLVFLCEVELSHILPLTIELLANRCFQWITGIWIICATPGHVVAVYKVNFLHNASKIGKSSPNWDFSAIHSVYLGDKLMLRMYVLCNI